MNTEQAHAAFEAWWPKQLWHECFEDVKDQMRNVWVASRAEVVVELPQPFEGDDFKMYDGAELRKAIESAGLTVKE
jgi:hypothetical protein